MENYGLQTLYDKIFKMSFLVRNGYYDIPVKYAKSNNLEYGNSDTFYSELFNMHELSEYIMQNDVKSSFQKKNINEYKSTEPIYFTIPKGENTRRQYKMPNIYSYINICYFIVDNRKEFLDIFLANRDSTSKYFGQLNFRFKTTQQIGQQMLANGKSRLKVDLSSFYHTLYTHSIPWMILGKNEAKKRDNSKFANKLDRYVMQCQFDETHGIPVGNLVSRIIAELYMCYFDREMENRGYHYSRYVDDITFPYYFADEKDSFIGDFNSVCREYGLISNEKKIMIDSFPFQNKMDKSFIFDYFSEMTSETEWYHWVDKINNFIDFCMNEEFGGNKGSIKSIFPVISNSLKAKKVCKENIQKIFSNRNKTTNFNLFERLFSLSMQDSRLTNRFLDFYKRVSKMGLLKSSSKEIIHEYFNENETHIKK